MYHRSFIDTILNFPNALLPDDDVSEKQHFDENCWKAWEKKLYLISQFSILQFYFILCYGMSRSRCKIQGFH